MSLFTFIRANRRWTANRLLLTLLAVPIATFGQTSNPCPPVRCLTITATRLSNTAKSNSQFGFLPINQPALGTPVVTPPQPTPTPAPEEKTALPTPRFALEAQSLPYGTEVALVVDKSNPSQTLEYSTDNGQSWVTGSSFGLTQNGVYLARTREGDRVSETTSATLGVYFKRLFVLGNSITQISPVPEMGWFNNNGMAASAPDKDFAHILERNLQTLNPQMQTKLLSGGGFEREFWSYDFDTSLDKHLRDYAPDLIVVRLGENMNDAEVARPERDFKGRFRLLLDKLKQFSGPAKVIVTTSFWDQAIASQLMREVAAERGYPVADIHAVLYNRPDRDQFRAINEYSHPAVGIHPNDRGMAEIARLIWEAIR